MKFTSTNLNAGNRQEVIPMPPKGGTPNGGFSLIEVLVVAGLLALIVFALMTVFSSTQRAFQASVTQTGVLEGGQAAADLISADLVKAATSKDQSFGLADPFFSSGGYPRYAVNFFVTNNGPYYQPLMQTLPGSSVLRTNLLQWFFVLGRQNTQWVGVGYIVNTASSQYFYPLYRYYGTTNTTASAATLFYNFLNNINNGSWTNLSHVVDGVVHMTLRAYNPNGVLMTNGYAFGTTYPVQNTWFSPPYPAQGGEVGFCMSSNALPAAVELQLGVLEDKAVQHAQAMGGGAAIFQASGALNFAPQWTYLQGQAGRVHLFRSRVTLENVDPTIYQ